MRRRSYRLEVLLFAALLTLQVFVLTGFTGSRVTGDRFVALIERGTELVRGLHARRAIPLTVLGPEQFAQLTARNFDSATAGANFASVSQPMVLLGLLPSNVDLRRILRSFQADAVIGWYSIAAKRIYVMSHQDGLTLSDAVTISHEYTHALQDQAFDLTRVRAYGARGGLHDSDRDLAISALIEGDATTEMSLFARAMFTPSEYNQFMQEANQAGVGGDGSVPYVTNVALFPYVEGSAFVSALLRHTSAGAGFERVNAVYRHPPVSTQEILHLDLYLQHPAAPAPDVAPPAPRLPRGWRQVDSDVVGAYELRGMLERFVDIPGAINASEVWRADRYTLFDRGADYIMAWHLQTDSPNSVIELQSTLIYYLNQRYQPAEPFYFAQSSLTYAVPDSAVAMRVSGQDIFLAFGSRGALEPVVSGAVDSMR